jgi:hypothetical protein
VRLRNWDSILGRATICGPQKRWIQRVFDQKRSIHGVNLNNYIYRVPNSEMREPVNSMRVPIFRCSVVEAFALLECCAP